MLLMNNHDGTFREEGLLRGIAVGSDGQDLGGMGIGPGDYDLDGHIDFVKTHFQDQSTGLYHNNGKGEFEDVTIKAGLAADTRYVAWGTGLVDLDNDGNPDILLVAGNVNPGAGAGACEISLAQSAGYLQKQWQWHVSQNLAMRLALRSRHVM